MKNGGLKLNGYVKDNYQIKTKNKNQIKKTEGMENITPAMGYYPRKG